MAPWERFCFDAILLLLLSASDKLLFNQGLGITQRIKKIK